MSKRSDGKVIGFDLGHGETALAMAEVGSNTAPNVLDLLGADRRQHVTAVAEKVDGEVLIGRAALRERTVKRLWLGFKKPTLEESEVRRPMQLLVQHITNGLLEAGTITDPDAVHWVFGAPSGWAEDTYRAYEKLLVEAGLGSVSVIPESRAALLYARDSGEVAVDGKRIVQSVLVVDIGSSTTDYTHIHDLTPKPADHGNIGLGASLIDREIMSRAVARDANSSDIAALLVTDPHAARKLELACRDTKEKFFRTSRAELLASGAKVGELTPLELSSGKEVVLDLRMTVAEMDAVLDAGQPTLGDLSWRQAFRDDLSRALASAGRVDLLLLTGGPSRMPFVVTDARSLVDDPGTVVLGAEPEVAIARGLALAGRVSIRGAGFRADVGKIQRKVAPLVKAKIPELAAAIAEAVANGVTDRHVIPAFRAWRENRVDTLFDMINVVRKAVSDDLGTNGTAGIGTVIGDWERRLRAELENITRPVCNRWYIESNALNLPRISVAPGRRVDVPVDTEMITEGFGYAANALNAAVAGVVAMTLFGGGMAVLFATGPFGVVVGAVIGFGILTIGRDAMMEKLQTAKIWPWARKTFPESAMVNKLRNSAADTETQLAAGLTEELTTEFEEKLVASIADSIRTGLDDAAERGELLIR